RGFARAARCGAARCSAAALAPLTAAFALALAAAAGLAAASPGAAARDEAACLARLHVDHAEVDRMLGHIHAFHAHLHLVADPVDLRRTLADQRHMRLMEVIIIVRQI